MSKVDVLCDTDREMMLEFSRLCVSRLNNYLPLKLFLSPFQHFLDANVIKEIEKDRLIIEYAATHFERGRDRDDMDINDIFEMTIKVDDEFVNKLSNPFFSVVIRYDDFAEIRKKRIAAFVNMVFDLLRNWQDEVPFPPHREDYFCGRKLSGSPQGGPSSLQCRDENAEQFLHLSWPGRQGEGPFCGKAFYDYGKDSRRDCSEIFAQSICG